MPSWDWEVARSHWDQLFSDDEIVLDAPGDRHWIDVVLQGRSFPEACRALEIGCGLGHDTRWLLAAGCSVTSLDFSRIALEKVARNFPKVDVRWHRLPDPLPFDDRAYGVVVAGLSLHYFRRADTEGIVGEIQRVLCAGGMLLFRVNAASDVNYGYGHGSEVETNVFDVGGRLKRFFSREECQQLFAKGWELPVLLPMATTRYGAPKHTWAGLAYRS